MAGNEHDRRLHADRAEIADRSSANGRRRAESARTRAAAAKERGEDDLARFHEEAATLHDVHEHHEQDQRVLEQALADGETILEYERRTGRSPETSTPSLPKPPRAPGAPKA